MGKEISPHHPLRSFLSSQHSVLVPKFSKTKLAPEDPEIMKREDITVSMESGYRIFNMYTGRQDGHVPEC